MPLCGVHTKNRITQALQGVLRGGGVQNQVTSGPGRQCGASLKNYALSVVIDNREGQMVVCLATGFVLLKVLLELPFIKRNRKLFV